MENKARENLGHDQLDIVRFQANPNLPINARVDRFGEFLRGELDGGLMVARQIVGPMDREVLVRDGATGEVRPMLMFGSNNYLGFANHPFVRQRVRESLDRWGTGLGGPPLLNGTMGLHAQLEQRVAALKKKAGALIYSSGFAANTGWLGALVHHKDVVVLDELCHASIFDGARAAKAALVSFKHNSAADLRDKLAQARRQNPVNLFVVVEGVYGMDGDVAPLDQIVPACKEFDAFIGLDDAHGTGVLGATGGGAAELFGLEDQIDLVMGTFSKALAASGGFVAARREMVDYLRFFSRSYFFSASMPPVEIVTILAGFELLAAEPERRTRLHDNVRYLVAALAGIGVATSTQSAVVPVYISEPIRRVSRRLHEAGIFVNAIEYPAVPRDAERFRISVMSEHTHEDLDRLVAALDEARKQERAEISKTTGSR
jgi:glycine C-acetyltransferase